MRAGTDLVHTEPGVPRAAVGHDAVVAREGEDEPAGEGVAVDRCDGGNWGGRVRVRGWGGCRKGLTGECQETCKKGIECRCTVVLS